MGRGNTVSKYLLVLCMVSTVLFIVHVHFSPRDFSLKTTIETKTVRKTIGKTIEILAWTNYFSMPFWGFKELGSVPFQTCAVNNCYVTKDKSQLAFSDAVLFHAINMERYPPNKTQNQIWISFVMESPCYYGLEHLQNYDNVINWTMGYHRDNEIKTPYGFVRKRGATDQAQRRDYTTLAKSKKKVIAWYSSNCHTQSKREKYIQELQKYVSVDVYGSCGNLKCDARKTCMEHLNKTYKFYLAFENSLSQDYISEKFFKVLIYDVVPIVRGGANYPKHISVNRSYINTKDFESPKKLAEHINFLDKNVEKYVEYLNWKDEYHGDIIQWEYIWCTLCEKLNNPTERKKSSVYKSIYKWWKSKGCSAPTDLNW